MPDPRPRRGRLGWPRLPRRSARLRLTVLYGVAFLACGTAVLAFAYLFYGHLTRVSAGLPAMNYSAQPNGASLGRQATTSLAHARAAQINAALREAAQNPAVHAALEQAKNSATRAGQFQIQHATTQLLIGSAIALAIIALAAAAIGWLIAGRVLRPLSTITAAARRISASNLNERLALHGPDDELRELGNTLDSLFARLEASFESQRRFAANASHELRTPLTRERTLLQVTLADPGATTGTWQAVSHTTRRVHPCG